MKNYILNKTLFLGLQIKDIIYDFKVQNSSKPTSWIKIIIHHSGNTNTIQKIIDLHINKNRWTCIGYHFLISESGQIHYSRKLDSAGAHCFGYNKNSIGIALLGNLDIENPTLKQIESLNNLIEVLKKEYSIKNILGHNQAIYKLIKEKFYKINLPNKNLLEINSKKDYDNFAIEITTKVLEFNAEKEVIDLLKRFKTCPGINSYNFLKEIQTTEK